MDITTKNVNRLGMLLLRTGLLMLGNGASTSRIRITVDRIAHAYGFLDDLLITHRALTLTLMTKEHEPLFSSVNRIGQMGVNFSIISGISKMSLNIELNPWSLDEYEKELERISNERTYGFPLRLILVSLAGAAFCSIAGGELIAIAVAFLATFAGFFVRHKISNMHFNMFLNIFFASLTATLVAGAFRYFLTENNMDPAFASSVLFLIPGVPLINSINDLIDGNLLNGILRVVNGLIISFMIALGMICSILFYNL